VADHDDLGAGSLVWTASAHTGTASRIAAFDGGGAASYLQVGVDVQAYDADLTTIAGLSSADGNFIVGTGAGWTVESGATARTSLGLGSLATQSTISNADWSGTDLAVINGGTGASDATTARSNLGLVIGTNVQAWDTNLDQIAALAVTDGNVIVGNGSAWVAESGATLRTSLGVGAGDTPTFSGLLLDSGTDSTLTIDKSTTGTGAIEWTTATADGAQILMDSAEAWIFRHQVSNLDLSIYLNDGGVDTMFMTFDASLVRIGLGPAAPAYHVDVNFTSDTNGAFGFRVVNNGTNATSDCARFEIAVANAGTSNIFCGFYDGGGALIGSITGDGAGVGVLYNTTSDRRLKREIEDVDPVKAAGIVSGLRVREYGWRRRGRGQRCIGLIAQEVAEVYPAAVGGPRPGSDEEPVKVAILAEGERRVLTRLDALPEGTVSTEEITPGHPDFAPMTVDYSKMVPLLIATVQDLQRQVDELRARLP
jgi:hypothetical protein